MAEILSDAYAQRDKIVNTAEKEAVRIREQGHEQGLEEALSWWRTSPSACGRK